MSQERINVGLIGCGDISREHLTTYKSLGLNVVALCDLSRERAEKRKQEFGLEHTEVYTDHNQLLKRSDIELVTVATPVAYHAPVTIAALEAGKHVGCEKPSTLDIGENRQIIAAADRAQKKVVFFSARMRWGSATLARQYIRDGEMGDIYRVDVQHYRSR